MSTSKLYETVAALMADGKGILAADESDATAGKRLEMVGLPNEPEHRQTFRELLFTAPGIEEYLSGVILYDSSIKNTTKAGMPFPDILMSRGMLPGIKVDMGTRPLQGFEDEVVTQGLDDLADRFSAYYEMGARFAKWRAVITIGKNMPSEQCLEMNSIMMTRYAQLAQEAKIVPIVEPEVIFAGEHTIEEAEITTTKTLQVLFGTLTRYNVDLQGVILKSSMVLAGEENKNQSSAEEVANATIRTFKNSVPHSTGGIVFLSGGQTPKRATENLQAIAELGEQPWPITYSYSRAIEEPFLTTWQGKEDNAKKAQEVLLETVKQNSLAQQGKYKGK